MTTPIDPTRPDGNPARTPATDISRADELRADRATVGISAEQQAELEQLELRSGAGADDSLDRTAAVLDVAFDARVRATGGVGQPAAMPAALRARLLASGQAWASQRRVELAHRAELSTEPRLHPAAHRDPSREATGQDARAVRASGRRVGWGSARVWGGWAAAACLLLALVLRPGGDGPRDGAGLLSSGGGGANGPAQAGMLPASPWGQLMELRDNPDTTLEIAPLWRLESWTAQVSLGRVHWFPGQGRGFLQVAGLPPIDADEQYQLWVRDGGRDAAFLVNAGVMDVSADDGEKLIPIQPSLRVFRADVFLISIERRGGNPQPVGGRFVALGKVSRGELAAPEPASGPPGTIPPVR